MKSFIELTPNGILTINRKGIIVNANSKALSVFNDYNLVSKRIHIDSLIGPDKTYKKDLCVRDIDNETACKIQKTLIAKNRDQLDVEIWVKRRPDGCYIGFIQDITEQKKDQERFKEIVHMQSHEVRAPLSNIMGLVNLVDLDNLSKDVNMSLLSNLKISAKKLDIVIRKIVKSAVSAEPVRKTRVLLFFKYYIPFRKFIRSCFMLIKATVKAFLSFFTLYVNAEGMTVAEKKLDPIMMNNSGNTTTNMLSERETHTITEPSY